MGSRQIYDRIRLSIANGKLRAGDRLPSTRTLADEFNVARGTVESAYSLLVAEGLLVGRGRRGTFVSNVMHFSEQPSAMVAPEEREPALDKEDFRYLFDSPSPLMPGLPSFDQFPRKLWYRTVARQARAGGLFQLTYPDPLGLPQLRQALASYLVVARGIYCDPEQIVITAGYLGALSLICRTLLKRGSRVWVESPGYGFTTRAIQMVGGTAIPIPVDDEGLNVEEAIRSEPEADLCVVAPSNQFPLGASLSLERRGALLEWAARAGGWIVEDDYTGEFRYDGWPLPALKSLNANDRVFYVGTFSKTMFPGLRIGYVIVPRSQFSSIRDQARRLDGGRSVLEQAALGDFVAHGHFGRHVKRMRGLYGKRSAALMSAVTEVFGRRLSIRLSGGLHLLARLDDDEDDIEMEGAAGEAGLRPLALSKMGQGRICGPGLILGFANLPEEQAYRIVRRLRRAIGPERR
jgi:GntR family transcriptional regulator/MocR family aminotransferase